MFPRSSRPPITSRNCSGLRRALQGLLPAAALGVAVWMIPDTSHAAPTCTSKPAVCSRLAAKPAIEPPLVVRAQTPRPVLARSPVGSCATKPAVCARLGARGTRPAAPPVTLASTTDPMARCNTKPAVCARLRVRPSAPPITLATTAGEGR